MRIILLVITILLLGIVIKYIHDKKLSGFPTISLRQCCVIFLLFITIIISNISFALKRIFLFCFIAQKGLYNSLVIIVHLIRLFGFKSYSAFRQIGRIIYSHNNLSFPSNPTIFIVNYPSDVIEYSAVGVFPLNTSFMVHKDIGSFLKTFFGKKIIVVDVKKKNTFNIIEKSIQNSISSGFHIFAYPEKSYYTRKNIYSLNPFRSGLFKIAKKLNITVTPVVIDHMKTEWPSQRRICILPPMHVDNVDETIQACRKMMTTKLYFMKYHC